jgi:hypothetical protein
MPQMAKPPDAREALGGAGDHIPPLVPDLSSPVLFIAGDNSTPRVAESLLLQLQIVLARLPLRINVPKTAVLSANPPQRFGVSSGIKF